MLSSPYIIVTLLGRTL